MNERPENEDLERVVPSTPTGEHRKPTPEDERSTAPIQAEEPPATPQGEATPADAHSVRDDTKMVPDEEMPKMPPAEAKQQDAEVEAQMRKMSRRSFLWGAVAVGTGYGGWRWINSRRLDDGVPWPFRRALNTTDELAQDYFRTDRLAPTFKLAQAGKETRVNGKEGLGDDFDSATWKLQVAGMANTDGTPTELTLAQIKALPRVEMVTELKCIEGWSVIVHWAGARLVDFMRKYPPATTSGNPFSPKRLDDLPAYVGMATPDNGYYVGLDMASAVHPQTLLCYEMDGKPLTAEHGAPLRLAIPVKYGVKNIKRIGTITYSSERPADYWAEQGYDYYAGH